ncbi:MAG: FIST N-terminal domain-containing protein [Campylobacterota bacterium]
MKIETLSYNNDNWQINDEIFTNKDDVQLVLAFGDTDLFSDAKHYEHLRLQYPKAKIVGSSSAGHLQGVQLSQSGIVASAISFKNADVKLNVIDFEAGDDLEAVAQELVAALPDEGLRSVFIISDGLYMNGTSLAGGVNAAKPNVLITGGLAGDGARFEKTFVMANAAPKEKRIAALGFYGESLHVSSGCSAGWNEFGAERVITRSEANVVYEIDNEPALELYKRYLGDEAKDLPGSGLHFPLSIRKNEEDKGIIRTILAVDEERQSLTFAGDVPEGCLARLMKTNIDGIIDASTVAAKEIVQKNAKSALGLVVSCIGRKLVMKDLTDEELETIEETVGSNVYLTGFYSYGELAPFSNDVLSCRLHNQTMTLTVMYED